MSDLSVGPVSFSLVNQTRPRYELSGLALVSCPPLAGQMTLTWTRSDRHTLLIADSNADSTWTFEGDAIRFLCRARVAPGLSVFDHATWKAKSLGEGALATSTVHLGLSSGSIATWKLMHAPPGARALLSSPEFYLQPALMAVLRAFLTDPDILLAEASTTLYNLVAAKSYEAGPGWSDDALPPKALSAALLFANLCQILPRLSRRQQAILLQTPNQSCRQNLIAALASLPVLRHEPEPACT